MAMREYARFTLFMPKGVNNLHRTNEERKKERRWKKGSKDTWKEQMELTPSTAINGIAGINAQFEFILIVECALVPLWKSAVVDRAECRKCLEKIEMLMYDWSYSTGKWLSLSLISMQRSGMLEMKSTEQHSYTSFSATELPWQLVYVCAAYSKKSLGDCNHWCRN